MSPSVTIVIVNFNGGDYVDHAIRSALDQRYDGTCEVVVVDNASTDESLTMLRRLDGIRLIENAINRGFGAGANTALRDLTSDYVAFLNPDALASPRWLAEIVPWMSAERVDLASSIVSAGTDIYFAGGHFNQVLGATLELRRPSRRVDWLSGCALVANRESMRRLGGFDEGFFLYYEDVDLTLRARDLGLSVAVLPEALVNHPRHGRSTDTLGIRKARIAYFSRGRLIAKHVRGWRRLTSLAFATMLSPIRNGVSISAIASVAYATLRGFRDAKKRGSRRDRRPTVGVLLNIYESTSGLSAGGHRHFIEVVRRWEHVRLVFFGPSEARDEILREMPQSRFVALPSFETAGKAGDFLLRSFAWCIELRSLRKCHVLVATSHFLPDVVPAVVSRRPAIVIVHHLIGTAGSAARNSIVPRVSEAAALVFVRLGARAVLVSSRLVERELRRRGFAMRIDVTTSGVDHFAPLERSTGIVQSPSALFVGRFHPVKGALDAIRIWEHVVRAEPRAILTLIGAREVEAYAREIDAYISSRGLEGNVVIRGQVDDAEKLASMAAAQLFLFPSREEGWGIAVAEAMRAGLPCVTYDLPIFAEIFPRGRLDAPLDDFEGMSEAVLRIVRDESLRSRLSAEASTLAADFSWSKASAIEGAMVNSFLP